jgi:hypothetical protein
VGGVVDIVSTTLFTLPISVYATLTSGALHLPPDRQQAAIVAALHANAPLYALNFAIGSACSVLGGFVAASITKRNQVLVGALSAFLCIGSGVYALASGGSSDPLWVVLATMPLSAVLGAAGGFLRGRIDARRLTPSTAA